MVAQAVICTSCGLDLRTGRKLVLEPEEKNRLSLKQQEPAPAERLNPILSRFQTPETRQPTFVERVTPALKAVALLLVIAGAGLAVMKYVDAPRLLNSIHGRPTEQVAITNVPPPAKEPEKVQPQVVTMPEKVPETKVASETIHILENLRSKPRDKATLQELMDKIMAIMDSNENRFIKSGLL